MSAVSVVIPLRNGGRWLAQCLRSVCAQSFREFEVVVVDDHSSDDGAAQARQWAREDPRIRVLRNPGRGLVAALNHGIGVARGELIARMDADDRMHPRRLAMQVAAFAADPALALVASRVRAFPASALTDGMREYLRWQDACDTPAAIARAIYVESPFAHPSVTFRRRVVADLGGYRDGGFPEDYDLWLRLARAGQRMAKLPAALLDWRQHAGSLSRTDPRYARDAFDALRAHYLRDDPRLAGDRPVVVWGAGRRTRRRARRLRAAGVAFAAFVDIDPRKVGNVVEGLPVHPPRWLACVPPGGRRAFVLVYVASHGARGRIAEALAEMGFADGEDYLQVG